MQENEYAEAVKYFDRLLTITITGFIYLVGNVIVLCAILLSRKNAKWNWLAWLSVFLYVLALIPVAAFLYFRSWQNPILAPIIASITVLMTSFVFFKLKRFRFVYGSVELAVAMLGAWASTRGRRGSAGYDTLFVITLLGSIYTGVRGFANLNEEREKRNEARRQRHVDSNFGAGI